jgi:beta-lactamase regulating signal transducer with metallopeptidase domain
MMTYFIKSTVCTIVLYGFFHFFLRHYKVLIFNRFYLISSLVFSLIIPLITIPVKSNFIVTQSLDKLTFTTGQTIHGKEIIGNATPLYTYHNIIPVLFIIVSSVLFLRFAINICRIITKTIKCKKIKNGNTTLILVEEKTLPYSFFSFVFLNKSDFESGRIEKELLIHEEAHCSQYHSADIILLELINVFFWFNPAIWFFRKAILLNHEYCADNTVLANCESFKYHQLLMNLVLQNNTEYLVSNFKYSLIKNRLIMMTKNRPSHNAILRKVAAITLFLFLGIAFTFSQDNKLTGNTVNRENGWWNSILQKHKIDTKTFIFINETETDSLSYVLLSRFFDMGTGDSLNKKVSNFKDAIFIFQEINDTYWIITSESAFQDAEKNLIEGKNGKMECFSYKSADTIPIKSLSYQEFKLNTKANSIYITSGSDTNK